MVLFSGSAFAAPFVGTIDIPAVKVDGKLYVEQSGVDVEEYKVSCEYTKK